MKKAAVIIGIFAVLGFVGGFIVAKLTTEVVPTMTEYRDHGPTREVPADWRFDKFSPGHSQHVVNLALDCNGCHDPAREDFKEVDIGVCTACHIEQASHPHLDEKGQITDCTTCHTFKFFAEAASPWDCARCHGPFDTPTHTGLAMHDDIACANCHHPHEPVEETAAECGDCHKTFTVQHGRPELSGGCSDCHGGHKLASEAAACMECHQEKPSRVPETAIFGRAGSGHDACVGCHEPHSFSKASATRCESCHERQPVLAQNKVRDHRDCASCHDPHAVRRAGDRTCKGCHEEVASTHPVEERGDCVSCHDPHPKQVSQIAMRCSSCHEDASSERAFHAPKAVCTDCHAPHEFDLSNVEPQSLCVECHATQTRLTRRIADHASCASCHTGTAHVLGEPAECASCHGELRDVSPEGHRECASCHEPHGGAISAANACTSCHESAGLPGLHRIPDEPNNPGHADCATCHNPHNAQVRADRASCMECHTDMADHQTDADVCTGCHTFISGKPASTLTPRARKRR
jgi:hypothetical protein